MPGTLISDTQATVERSALAAMLTARRFDITLPPPKAEPVFLLDGVAWATRGNLSTIIALQKAGKSAFCGAMTAAVIGGEGDCLGLVSGNPCDLAHIVMDTEQAPFDHWTVTATALKRVQANVQPSWLHSYSIVDVDLRDRFALLEYALDEARSAHSGIHSVILDGAADFISSPNDEQEAFGAVARLHKLAVDFDTHIACVVHINPGSEGLKSRGHLGSQLERKAETTIVLERVNGITAVYTKSARHAPIDKERGHRFRWCDEVGMQVSCETMREEKARETSVVDADTVESIFAEKPSLRYGELKEAVKLDRGVKDRAAEGIIKRLRESGLIRHGAMKGFYVQSS